MSEPNNNRDSKIKENLPFIFIFSVCLFVTLFAVLRPYYYRFVFDSSISDGNNKEVEALLNDSNFIQYATLEQGQKAIDVAIKTNRDSIDSKLALFDTSSFKKFGNNELGKELSDSILETALKLDDTTKLKLLEDSRFINNASIEQIQKSLDVAIKTNRGNLDSKLSLFDTASFKKFGNNELGRELSDSILETALKLDNAARFKLLEDSRFVSHASKEQVQKAILPILENIAKDDRISRYKLLENDGIKPFWNDKQPQNLLKNIAESFNSKNIEELYEFLDKPCFKQYGTTEIGEAIVASMSQILLKSSVDEKMKFLSNSNVKQYISKRDRKSVIDSIADFPTISKLNTSLLDKFFLEICNQQEIINTLNKIEKQNKELPNTIISWMVKNILKESSEKKILYELIKDNDSAKIYILKEVAQSIWSEKDYKNKFTETKNIINTFPLAFDEKIKNMMDSLKEGIDTIEQVEKDYGSSAYSTIHSLKNERDNIPNILKLRGNIVESLGTYPNPELGNLEGYLIYRVYIDGYYYCDAAILYTCETSFTTKGSFEIFVQKINLNNAPSKYKNFIVFVEEPLKNVFRYEEKYEHLTNQINRLEKAASIYEKNKKQAQEAVNTLRHKISDILYEQASNLKYEKALADYKKDKNNITALETLGNYYYFKNFKERYGNKNDKNLQEAIKYYKLAADINSEIACGRLIEIFREKKDDKNYVDYLKKYVDYFHRDGSAGDLGEIYLFGLSGVSINKKLAIKYLKKSNAPYDLYLLGNIYYEGDGVKKDLITAARYYREALYYNKTDEYYNCSLDEKVTEKATSRLNKINKLLETKTKEEISELSINEIEQKLNSNNDVYYVSTKSGINLRDIPSTKGNKVGKLANKTKITILSKNGPEEVIENIRSNWYKVTDGEVTGWCFGGFVSIINK